MLCSFFLENKLSAVNTPSETQPQESLPRVAFPALDSPLLVIPFIFIETEYGHKLWPQLRLRNISGKTNVLSIFKHLLVIENHCSHFLCSHTQELLVDKTHATGTCSITSINNKIVCCYKSSFFTC